MQQNRYYKLAGTDPADLASRLRLDALACSLLMPEQSVSDYVISLAETGQFRAALSVLAHALPKREAVWWGCVAVRYAEVPPADSDADTALAAAEAWVYQPSEDTRRPTGAAASRAGLGTAAGWAAIAAYWSSGSLSPEDTPPVPPGPELTGKAVAGATTLAALNADPPDGYFDVFIRMALDIASGGDGRHPSP
jgi:Family of unknown function (DUF6931)